MFIASSVPWRSALHSIAEKRVPCAIAEQISQNGYLTVSKQWHAKRDAGGKGSDKIDERVTQRGDSLRQA